MLFRSSGADDSCADENRPPSLLHPSAELSVGRNRAPLIDACDFEEPRLRRASDRVFHLTLATLRSPSGPASESTMGEREDLVYQAKLAEQAERYDGEAAGARADSVSRVSVLLAAVATKRANAAPALFYHQKYPPTRSSPCGCAALM